MPSHLSFHQNIRLQSQLFRCINSLRVTADRAARNLLTFIGARYKHLPNVLCKAGGARELISAITQIGWVHESSLENRFPHNALLEREIMTLEESMRALHFAAGSHVVPDFSDIRPVRCSDAYGRAVERQSTISLRISHRSPIRAASSC